MTTPLIVLSLSAGLLLASPAGAQPAAPAERLPAAPAPAPPAPADLAPRPRPAQPPPAATLSPLALPAGMEALPQGGFRLRFEDAAEEPPPTAVATLGRLGSRLAADPDGRVTLIGQASGPATDVSIARRLSLARALAVKQALVAGGLAPTRIDIRPMGRTADAVDAVDIQPPETERAR